MVRGEPAIPVGGDGGVQQGQALRGCRRLPTTAAAAPSLCPCSSGVEKPPFAFSLIQARNLSGWDGSSKTAVMTQFLADVRQKLEGGAGARGAATAACCGAPGSGSAGRGEAEREWRSLDLDVSDDPGLLIRSPPSGNAPTRSRPTRRSRRRRGWKLNRHDAGRLRSRSAKRVRRSSGVGHRGRPSPATARRGTLGGRRDRRRGAPGVGSSRGPDRPSGFKDLDVGLEMVVVPAGGSLMRSTAATRKQLVVVFIVVYSLDYVLLRT